MLAAALEEEESTFLGRHRYQREKAFREGGRRSWGGGPPISWRKCALVLPRFLALLGMKCTIIVEMFLVGRRFRL